MKVFIDANIYLSFLRLSGEKLSSLESLLQLVTSKKVYLIFPKITQDEVLRNIPNIAQTYVKGELNPHIGKKPISLATNLKGEDSNISKLHNAYISELKKIRGEYLDRVKRFDEENIEPLIKNSTELKYKEIYYKKAIRRKHLGNPPGKGNHVGDELVWEMLLANSREHSFAVVSGDNDWKNVALEGDAELNPYLKREWSLTKPKNEISFFDTLGSFMKKQENLKISENEIQAEKIAGQEINNITTTTSFPTLSGISSSLSSVHNPFGTSGTYALGSSATTTTSTINFSEQVICPNCGTPTYYTPYIHNICSNCGQYIQF